MTDILGAFSLDWKGRNKSAIHKCYHCVHMENPKLPTNKLVEFNITGY